VINLTSGLSGVFSITRTGVVGDPEIPAGGSGIYAVEADAAGIGSPTIKAARYSLNDGGFDFEVNWLASPFKTQFVDALGNAVTAIDLGVVSYVDSAEYRTVNCYLKRISAAGTAMAEGVKIRSQAADGSTNRAEVTTEGTLATSSVEKIPVFITLRPPLWAGQLTAIVTADHGVNQVQVTITWQYERAGTWNGFLIPAAG
jgi:hypothetical protein